MIWEVLGNSQQNIGSAKFWELKWVKDGLWQGLVMVDFG